VPSSDGSISNAAWLNLISSPQARLRVPLDESIHISLADEWLPLDERRVRENTQSLPGVRFPSGAPWHETVPQRDKGQDESDLAQPQSHEPVVDDADSVHVTDTDPLVHFDDTPDPSAHTQSLPQDTVDLTSIETESSIERKSIQNETPPTENIGIGRRLPHRSTRNQRRAPFSPGSAAASKWKSDFTAKLSTRLNKGVWTAPEWTSIIDYLHWMRILSQWIPPMILQLRYIRECLVH